MTESQRMRAKQQPKRKHSPFRPVIFLAIVFLGVAAIFVIARNTGPAERIAWQTDLPRAMQSAEASNKQVLLYFTADWCGPCEEMKRTIFSDAEVEQALRFHVPVKINIDQQPVLARKYAVDSIPHFTVLDPNGEVLLSDSGFMTSQHLMAWVQRAAKPKVEW